MADPRLPTSLVDEIKELQRRLTTLERLAVSSKGASSLRGSLVTAREDAIPVVRQGIISPDPATGDGRRGIEAGVDPDGERDSTWFRVSEAGVELPYIPLPMYNDITISSASTTSGTFGLLWSGTTMAVPCKALNGWIGISTSANTTGEVRVGHPLKGYSAVKTVGGVPSSSGQYDFKWLLPSGFDLGVSDCTFYIEARRTSGAGSISVWQPRLAFGLTPDATTDGWV